MRLNLPSGISDKEPAWGWEIQGGSLFAIHIWL